MFFGIISDNESCKCTPNNNHHFLFLFLLSFKLSFKTESQVYQERGVKDKERYKTEMAVYKERLKIGQFVSTATPILQHPAEQELEVGNPDAKVEMDDDYILLCDQNDSSIDGEDNSEGKDLDDDDDSEIETSLDVGQNATGSFRLAEHSPDQKDGFELRRRELSLLPKE